MTRTRLGSTHDLFINGLVVSGSRVVSSFATPTTRRGDALVCTQDPLEAPLDDGVCVVCVELWVLSLSVEEGRSTFVGVAGILAKF